MKTCPACGQLIIAHRVPVEALIAAPLSSVRLTIIRKLVDSYPVAITADGLLFTVYGGAHEPENARNVLSVQLAAIREIIKPYGWTISKSAGGRGNYGMYKLKPCDSPQLTRPNLCSSQENQENPAIAIDTSKTGSRSTDRNMNRKDAP